MSVLPFPTARMRARPRRPDRVELWLLAGLVVTTTVQIGLFAWTWIG